LLPCRGTENQRLQGRLSRLTGRSCAPDRVVAPNEVEETGVKNAWPLAVLALLAAVAVPAAWAHSEKQARQAAAQIALVPAGRVLLVRRIELHRDATWRLERLMGRRRTPYGGTARHARSSRYLRWVLTLWTQREAVAQRRWRNPPHKAAWLCIHRYEGSWRDPGGPYYGGLQMDIGFQSAYGAPLLRTKGTANNWSPTEQMWVAERAYRSGRGFWPWPNTARICGLI
jgi:hypothetical protein